MFAKLEFGDNTSQRYVLPRYNVVSYGSKISRSFDCNQPFANPMCKCIEIAVNSLDKMDMTFVDWYIGGGQKSGKITFDIEENVTSDVIRQSIVYFEDAFCIAIAECYDIENAAIRQLKLTIIPMSIKVCDIDFVRSDQI